MDYRKVAIIVVSIIGAITIFAGCETLRTETAYSDSANMQKKVKISSLEFSDPDVTANPPLDWPTQTAWLPQRHFGPFLEVSKFDEIQVLVQQGANQSPQWYFNDYFRRNRYRRIYSKYFQNGVLPTGDTSATPQLDNVPGQVPARGSAGFGDAEVASTDILFVLDQIRYTSRYGGSVEFSFQTAEDYEYELRRGSKLWDIQSMELYVYSNLKAASFNPIPFQSNLFEAPVYAELRPRAYQMYNIDTDFKIRASKNQHEEALESALQKIADRIASHVNKPANQFAHGYVHTQFQAALPPDSTNKVRKVLLSENYLDLHFTERVPLFTLRGRLTGIHAPTLDLFSNEEFRGFLSVGHKYKGKPDEWHRVYFPGDFGTIEAVGYTYWLPLGHWSLEECQFLEKVTVNVYLMEDDPAGHHLFDIKTHKFLFEDNEDNEDFVDFVIDCEAVQNAHQQQNYGVLKDHRDLHPIEGFGSYMWYSRLELWVR
jgi:hypothetical protein